MRRFNRGVTLIELVTVVMVIGILAAIAIPSYRGYVIRANRSDAKASLLSTASALERCYTQFNAYNNGGCTVVLPVASNDGKYQISATYPDSSKFILTATPQGEQAKDSACSSFKLTEAGVKSISGGSHTAADCWAR